MKKSETVNGWSDYPLKKTFLIMRIIVFLLLATIFQTYANDAYSQRAKLSLNFNNTELEQVLDAIENQSEFFFLYNEKLVDVKRKVSLRVSNAGMDSILEQLFEGTDVEYAIVDRKIVLAPEDISSVIQQQQGITGIVKDHTGLPLPGVSVVIKGTTSGTITDMDGNFQINNLPANASLVFSFVGMRAMEVQVGNQSNLSITMEEETIGLDEVVAIGFGTQKKENLTGSLTQVRMDEILGDRPIINAAAALQGSVPGLLVTGNHQVGQQKSFQIRGAYSIGSGSTISPLVLIDNVEGNIDMVNPEDIESITVLKDAASSAIYGARAAGGVIIVTTKRPKSGASFQLNYNNNIGIETAVNLPEQAPLDHYFSAYLDAGFGNSYWAARQDVTKWQQYLKDYKSNPAAFNIVGDGVFVDSDGVSYYLNEKDTYSQFMESSLSQSHNFSGSGGTDKLRYRISGGYTDQDGTLITSKDRFTRINVASFISADLTTWFTQELDIKYAKSDKSLPGNDAGNLFNTRLISYYPDGIMPKQPYGLPEDMPVNTPMNTILYGNTVNTISANPRIFTRSILKPFKDFEAILEYTFDQRDVRYDYYSGNYMITDIQQGSKMINNSDYYIKRHYFTDYNAINAYATYSKSFGDHHFKLMGGYNQESSYYEYVNVRVQDQAVLTVPSLDGATGDKQLLDNYIEYAIRGGFFRFNYNFQDRYLLEVNGRYDGSSKFPKSNRFGYFPSVSLGWQIARESFMEGTRNWLDELKLRVSWGEIGNQNISAYQFSPSMSLSTWTASTATWLHNGEQVTIVGIPALVSSTFTWENVSTLDFGLDYTLFKGRMQGTFDWYERNTTGMLAPGVQLPAVVGAPAPLQNTADLRTRGWEFALSWKNRIGALSYRFGINLTDYESVVTKYENASGLLSDYYEGMVSGEIWGYLADGFYSIDDFESTSTWKLKEGVTSINGYSSVLRPGDVKFKNLSDKDGTTNMISAGMNSVEDPGDRSIIGNDTPRLQYGANAGAGFKGFDLNVIIQGVAKRDVWLGGAAIFPFGGVGPTDAIFRPVYYNQIDYWQPNDPSNGDYSAKNPDATLPRIYGYTSATAVGSNTRVSDKYLSDASYLRVKNVTLAYTFPKNWIDPYEMKALKLFIGVENLATFSSLPKGYDPETISWTYPLYRTISFGVNVTF